MLILYLVMIKSSVLHGAKGREVGETRDTGSLHPDGKTGSSIGYRGFQRFCGCSVVFKSVDFSSHLCSPCSDSDRPS